MMPYYRNYQDAPNRVRQLYQNQHREQTLSRNQEIRTKYISGHERKPLWEVIQSLDQFVDQSDPDLDLTQVAHAFQTAERARQQYPDLDWLHLVGLIHDCGKILLTELPEYWVVGDTFPLGCAWSSDIIYHESFKENPDSLIAEYQTKCGIYSEHCGLDQVIMSWGHDEYMYRVCTWNQCHLPKEGLFIIRYHSFYSQHQKGAYDHLLNDQDQRMMEWVRMFQKLDLYSKDHLWNGITPQMEEYYQGLIKKYFSQSELVW